MGDTKNNMKINNSTIFLKDIRCYSVVGVATDILSEMSMSLT